jgi:glycosyltransferase involved in cell wall biosynthesis
VCRKDKCLDAVVKAGYNGFLYNNVETFKHSIRQLLSDERLEKSMGQNAAGVVRQQYSATQFSVDVVNLYHKVIFQTI